MNRQKLRNAIIERDGCGCWYCGKRLQYKTKAKRLPPHYMQLEHIVPKAHGGSDDTDNIVGACKECNRRKGTKPVKEFVSEELRKARLMVSTLEKRMKSLD